MRLLAIALAALSVPCSAQVQVQQGQNVDHLEPQWIKLTDGSKFALMVTSDLNTVTMLRCWEHGKGAFCFKASESWPIEGVVAHSIEWAEADALPKFAIPVAQANACGQVLDEIKDDGSLPNCRRLLESLYVGGPLALARPPITSIAPRREDLPSSLIRQAPTP